MSANRFSRYLRRAFSMTSRMAPPRGPFRVLGEFWRFWRFPFAWLAANVQGTRGIGKRKPPKLAKNAKSQYNPGYSSSDLIVSRFRAFVGSRTIERPSRRNVTSSNGSLNPSGNTTICSPSIQSIFAVSNIVLHGSPTDHRFLVVMRQRGYLDLIVAPWPMIAKALPRTPPWPRNPSP